VSTERLQLAAYLLVTAGIILATVTAIVYLGLGNLWAALMFLLLGVLGVAVLVWQRLRLDAIEAENWDLDRELGPGSPPR
jgi:hypothetical protein